MSGYNGNIRLSTAKDIIEFTKDQVAEYIKCSQDIVYFIRNYIKIINVDDGLVPFDMWAFQEDLVKTATENRFTIAKMPRQVGKTTTVAAIILWYVLFSENFQALILAHKAEQAREILGRIQLSFENLPKWLQQGIVEWNKGSVVLLNGSKIVATSTSSSAARGRSQNLVYLDEFAFVPSNMQEAFFASVYPTISSGITTKVLITSTPNGLNTFYKIWTDAELGRNSYKRVSVNWWDVPGRDEAWKKQTIDNTSERQFRQEFECHFLGSSNTLIDGQVLSQLQFFDPIDTSTPDMKIYELPIAGHLYALIVDTSRATGNDNSAFIVVDISAIPYKVVCTYKNNLIPVVVYPTIIKSVADRYNSAYVLVESNDIGAQVADILHSDLECDNLVLTNLKGRGGVAVATEFSTSSRLGVKTTKSVKAVGCMNLKNIVENQKIHLMDYSIISELSRFALKGASYEAEEGTDDLVMCLVLFSWFQADPYMKNIVGTGMRESLNEKNQQLIEDNITPFGEIITGHESIYHEVNDLPSEMSFEQWLLS